MPPRPKKLSNQSLTPAVLGRAFRTEWIDFECGIRIGNLELDERITQIMKTYLQDHYQQPFVCDRYGRGSFWGWMCWVPRRNREAKPISHDINFGCAKLFISVFGDETVFKCGMQVERGRIGPGDGKARWFNQPDWDWHNLVRQLRKGSRLDGEMARLLREDGFEVWIGNWDAPGEFTAANYKSASQLKRPLKSVKDDDWAGFQLYYPMTKDEVHAMQGHEFIEAVCAAFGELTEAMNCVMDVPLSETSD